jgi:alpha-amylase/alpha-mannosidase (GH57 family)
MQSAFVNWINPAVTPGRAQCPSSRLGFAVSRHSNGAGNEQSAIRFCFGLHLHQPVGNFGYVFEQHVREVYRPFLEHVRANSFFPITLHVSGPLIEWLDQHDPSLLDDVADLASDGRVELLLAGFYEPILASLPRADRLTQAWMHDAIAARGATQRCG